MDSNGNCLEFQQKFDEIRLHYTGQYTYYQYEMQNMLNTYSTCINTSGNSEQYCAAVDICLEKNNNNATLCTGSYLDQYYNPTWVAGNCNET